MNPTSPLITSLLITALCACASDPNKNAQDAYHAELKDNRQQQQSAMSDQTDAKLKSAEARQENTTAPAGATDATKTRVEADSKVTQQRAVYKAKATERVEKADARLTELKMIVTRAGGKATTVSRESIATSDTQRDAAKRDIDALDRVAADDWKRAETQIETQLETLESYVKLAAKEVDKFK